MTQESQDVLDSDVLIDVRNVSKCYHLYGRPQDRLLQSLFGGRKKFYRDFWSLKDVSLQVRRGEAVGIIGRNGAGKSTLLQLVTGTLTPTSGEISVKGRVAALLQLGSGFNPEFTGRENVYLNGAILGFSRNQIAQRFDEIAAFADIGEFIEQPVKTYSSGMTMRLAFAVSVCLEPEVLIIDEALSVGDAVFQFKCKNRLSDLIAKGTTLLFVSHDMGSVKSFCTRVVYLEDGKKKAEGNPVEIAESYFFDVRAAESKGKSGSSSDGSWSMQKKKGSGFGSAFGEIGYYCFLGCGNNAVVRYGDIVELEIGFSFSDILKNPALSIQLQSPNMLVIGGQWIRLKKTKIRDIQHGWIVVRFFARLNVGKYFLTLRLEDRAGENDFFPVHKIPGALNFEVVSADNNSLLGSVDLGFAVEFGEENAL